LLDVADGVDIEVSTLHLHELEVSEPSADFDAEVAEVEARVLSGRVAGSGPARALYRRFGQDPTRHRPSSEALLRRVRRGDRFPRVNTLVDVANLVSLRLQVPVGLYDLDRVQGRLSIRLGLAGESYVGIGKDAVKVAGRLCVADEIGACGNPSADSARTMISTDTHQAAWIFFLPVRDRDLRLTYELVARYGRGLVRVPDP
jgi:DNA/RNA-binding domain of Phe-tRNA-synthetase-like protein